LLIVGLVVLLTTRRTGVVALFTDRTRVLDAVRGAGAWGPLVLIGLTVAQVIAAPIPGQAVNFVAGYLFGFWRGGLYSWLGTLVGSILAIALARVAGRPLVVRLAAKRLATLERLDRFAAGRGLGFFFLVFLIPFLPDDVACFLAGLTPLPLPALIAVAAVGRIPGVITAVWAGAYADRLSWPGWVVAGVLVAVALVLTWRYGERVQEALMRWITNKR
jgi:uncharacterized membrane protein YdjX (TVP38/TMEM64 family)